MVEVTASATVSAPPERVWEFLCDTSRYAEWVVDTDEVTRTDGPAAPGSTYDERNPIAGPWMAKTHWRVTEFEAPRRQLHEGEGIPLMKSLQVVMELAPVGDASEFTVTLRGEPSGPLGRLFASAMKGQTEKNNRRTVRNLAELVARET